MAFCCTRVWPTPLELVDHSSNSPPRADYLRPLPGFETALPISGCGFGSLSVQMNEAFPQRFGDMTGPGMPGSAIFRARDTAGAPSGHNRATPARYRPGERGVY